MKSSLEQVVVNHLYAWLEQTGEAYKALPKASRQLFLRRLAREFEGCVALCATDAQTAWFREAISVDPEGPDTIVKTGHLLRNVPWGPALEVDDASDPEHDFVDLTLAQEFTLETMRLGIAYLTSLRSPDPNAEYGHWGNLYRFAGSFHEVSTVDSLTLFLVFVDYLLGRTSRNTSYRAFELNQVRQHFEAQVERALQSARES